MHASPIQLRLPKSNKCVHRHSLEVSVAIINYKFSLVLSSNFIITGTNLPNWIKTSTCNTCSVKSVWLYNCCPVTMQHHCKPASEDIHQPLCMLVAINRQWVTSDSPRLQLNFWLNFGLSLKLRPSLTSSYQYGPDLMHTGLVHHLLGIPNVKTMAFGLETVLSLDLNQNKFTLVVNSYCFFTATYNF